MLEEDIRRREEIIPVLLVRCFAPLTFLYLLFNATCLEDGFNQDGPYYCPDPDSPLSLWSHGYSLEIPTSHTPPGAMDLDGFTPQLLSAEIEAESKHRPPQELIDRLDVVRSSALRPFSHVECLPDLRTYDMRSESA